MGHAICHYVSDFLSSSYIYTIHISSAHTLIHIYSTHTFIHKLHMDSTHILIHIEITNTYTHIAYKNSTPYTSITFSYISKVYVHIEITYFETHIHIIHTPPKYLTWNNESKLEHLKIFIELAHICLFWIFLCNCKNYQQSEFSYF